MSKREKVFDALQLIDNSTLAKMWNLYQEEISKTKTAEIRIIYTIQDDFDAVMGDYHTLELATIICKSVSIGKFNSEHNYFEITGSYLLHSFNDVWCSDYFSFTELAGYIISANDDMGNRDIRKILNEPEISKNEVIKNLCEKMPHELVDEWNDYQKKINSHKIIMSMEDDFNSVLKDFTPYELASLIGGSTQMMYFNPNSVYFYYDSIQNKLYSFDDPGDIYFFSLEELAKHIVTTA